MTLLYQSAEFLHHDTGYHPECADRLRAVSRYLADTELADRCQQPSWEAVDQARIARVHDLNYVQQVRQLAERGGGSIDADTVVSEASYEVACRAAGAVCDAVRRVSGGEDPSALCLVRPPGHHALQRSAMGFCLLNNIALGAKVGTDELGLDRVLIVDWDVHHGNGTQDTFWEDERVGFFSIHRWPFYPGTGQRNETGGGAGLGGVCNVPIEMGTSWPDYLAQFSGELETFAERIQPDLILLSAGFDSHRQDPIGSLGLEVEHFGLLTDIVRQIADQHAGGRIVSVLEGGYNPPILAECVGTHLQQLLAPV